MELLGGIMEELRNPSMIAIEDIEEKKDSYKIAKGPDELALILDLLLENLKNNPDSEKLHTILYELGHQKSLIKVDLNQHPFKFWYNDLLGRPATKTVKEVIAKFLWKWNQ